MAGSSLQLSEGGAPARVFSLRKPGAREAYVVSWISMGCTIIAFSAGLVISIVSKSSATMGFALENAVRAPHMSVMTRYLGSRHPTTQVDSFSSGLVLWRFWGGGSSIPEATLELREKRASIGIAIGTYGHHQLQCAWRCLIRVHVFGASNELRLHCVYHSLSVACCPF